MSNTDTYLWLQRQWRAAPRTWLVTGVAGFIGSHLLQTLLNLDQRVVGLDNLSTGHRHNLDAVRECVTVATWDQFEFIEGDLRDAAVCQQACRGVTHVLHQANLEPPACSPHDRQDADEINMSGFLNLLIAARDNRVHSFTYASRSSDCYTGIACCGDPNHPLQADTARQHPCGSPTPQGIDELYAKLFARTFGFGSVGLRYGQVFGPRQHACSARAILRGEPMHIRTGGETGCGLRCVNDVVQANLLAAAIHSARCSESPWQCNLPHTEEMRQAAGDGSSPVGLRDNLAEQPPTRLNAVFCLLRNGLVAQGADPATQPVRLGASPGQRRLRPTETRPSRGLPGYTPAHPLQQGLAPTTRWYAQRAGTARPHRSAWDPRRVPASDAPGWLNTSDPRDRT